MKSSQWIMSLGCCVGLVLAGCGSSSEVIVGDVPESENLFFTEQGRLFVSGGSNVFEVIKNADGTFQKLDMFHGNCLVEGTIQRYDYVYAVCSKTNFSEFADSYFLAGKISDQAPTADDVVTPGVHPFMELSVISPMLDVGVPNGIDVDEQGNIFISDSGKGDIFNIVLDDPMQVDSITVWDENTAFFVNGLNWVGDRLYYTGIKYGTLVSVFGYIQRNPDGTAGERTVLYERAGTVLDDFVPYAEGFVITDYLKGTLLYWSDGEIQETKSDTFFAPTAVMPTQGPMFEEGAFLITEKGIIFNNNPAFGNRLGWYDPGFGL